MVSDFADLRDVITTSQRQDILQDWTLNGRLRLVKQGDLEIFYAPLDFVNRSAKIVLVGLTPGRQQASLGVCKYFDSRSNGDSDEKALESAKSTASFAGDMRIRLAEILDSVGISRVIPVERASQLFGSKSNLVHYTSVLRYPVLKMGGDYSGNPKALRTPILLEQAEHFLDQELRQLNSAIWVPLGPQVTEVLRYQALKSGLDSNHILAGMPHPSGANGERIAYFLRRKPRSQLSIKTDPDKIDQNRLEILAKIDSLATEH